ncbi:integrase, partial [Paraburkholderia sp. BR14264]
MKTCLTIPSAAGIPADFPDADALAALRAWYEGASSRDAVRRYLHGRLGHGESARGVIGQICRRLALYARSRQRADLATLFECPAHKRMQHSHATAQAAETLRTLPSPPPQ